MINKQWKLVIVVVLALVGTAWASTKMRDLIITSSTIDSTTIGLTTPSAGAFTTLAFPATPVNCLTTACSGGTSCPTTSTYSSGTTYTNCGSVPVIEEVEMTFSGPSATGGDATITGTSGGLTMPGNGVWNQCNGIAGMTYIVAPLASFSATAVKVDGCSGSTATITSWIEAPL